MFPVGYDIAAFLADTNILMSLFTVVVPILAAIYGTKKLLGVAKRLLR